MYLGDFCMSYLIFALLLILIISGLYIEYYDYLIYKKNSISRLLNLFKHKSNWHKISFISDWCCSIGRHDFFLELIRDNKVILICNKCPKRREIEKVG